MKDAQEPKSPNRLINEISPYLLQHADNPVDWYAWGEEAFEKAVKEDKPIFLSVGYATCHWCHVMERESFNEEEIAQILNEHFVSVKVDREEHPDVDSVYMQAVMLFTGGHGGWPMSVFLTPDLKPFFGGTYFPKDQFKRILLETMKLWQNERQKVLGAAEEVSRIITSQLQTKVPSEAVDEQILKSAEDTLLRMVDKKWGGFTGAPKFPPHQTLEFFLRRYKATKRMPLLEVSELTLKQMAQGGIYDQIGGGFHRYSVDERWLVPHFEKMLYDNAQLAQIYAKVYTINDDLFFKKIADGIYNFVLREMTSPNGAFYSALDAESYLPSTSQKEEGAFYLWHPDEVISVLDKQDGELFCKIYDITNQPNFFNPHTGYKGSIPNLIKAPVENWGKAIKLNPNE